MTDPTGVPFLRTASAFFAIYPLAKLYVEWAPGSDLSVDQSFWTWQEITNDVLLDGSSSQSIDIKQGRGSETSSATPAQCGFLLDNSSGSYSRGPGGANYGNIKLNIPVRVSVSLTGDFIDHVVRFQGYTNSLRPGWDETGGYATVELSASGTLRRLQQGEPSLRSAVFRYNMSDSTIVDYWPMEDISGAKVLSNAISGGNPMTFTGLTLASYSGGATGVPGSDAIPVWLNTGSYNAYVAHSFSGQQWEVHAIVNFTATPGADVAYLRVHTSGVNTIRWEIAAVSGSTTDVNLKAYKEDGTTALNTSTAFTLTVGQPYRIRLMCDQNGTGVDWRLVYSALDGQNGSAFVASGTVASSTIGNVTQISSLPSVQMVGASVGHIAVFDAYNHTSASNAFEGWIYDTPSNRIERLCDEELIDSSFVDSTGSIDNMGIQTVDSLTTILRECEQVDRGILGDGLSPGLYYYSRTTLLNRTPTVSLAVTDLIPPFQPEDDDNGVLNKVTATRKFGSYATVTDVDGPLGTEAIDIYETSETGINNLYDSQMLNYAGWIMHFGQVDDYRYPIVCVDWRRSGAASKADDWLTMTPGKKLDIAALNTWNDQTSNATIELRVMGWSERLSNFYWDVSMNCSASSPWNQAEIAASTGAFNDWVLRTDVVEGNSLVALAASAGATTLRVTTGTNSSNKWAVADTGGTNRAFYLNIAGWKVRATAISYTGLGYDQFTVDALPANIALNSVVKLWQQSVLGL